MKLAQAFRMSIKAILGKKGRSFLTMLGIIIGVAAVVVLTSLTQAQNELNMSWMREMGDNTVSVNANAWRMPKLPGEILDYVSAELVSLTVGSTVDGQLWNRPRITYQSKTMEETAVYIGSADFSMCKNYKIELGRDLSYMDVMNNNNVVVLGSRVKEMLFNYRNPIGEYIRLNNHKFLVIGVYKERNKNEQWSLDDMILVPYTQVRILSPNQTIDQYVIKAKDPESVEPVMEKMRSFLATKFEEEWNYGVWSQSEYANQMEEINRGQTIMLASIAGISLIVGGIGIMNIMLVTVTERTREIGIRKAIGAERRSIIAQFLIEASVLSFIGGLIGVLFGFLITLFWGKITYDIVVLPWWPMTLGALLFSVALGVGFGLYPAAKASRLQPVVALRNE